MHTPSFLTLSALMLALGGCGQPVSAPSLAQRPVEKQSIDMPVTSAGEAEGAPDATLVAQSAALVAAARAGDAAFAAQRTQTETAVTRASGAAAGSEAWIAAQESVTALDAARGPVRDAASAIDALRAVPANAAAGNRRAINEAAASVAAMDDIERQALSALAARLG